MRKAVFTDAAAKGSGPYSQAIITGDTVYVSGQGPLDPETGAVVGETIEEQAELTLRNIQNILEAAGSSMDDVVKVGVFLAHMSLFERFNSVYVKFFTQPMPARTCVEAGLDGILVEIDAISKMN